jgi:hypothetical protein
MEPQPVTARPAHDWGVPAEALSQALGIGRAVPEESGSDARRSTCVHFIQSLKERIVRGVGCGLSVEVRRP